MGHRTKKVADFPSGRGYRYFKTINQIGRIAIFYQAQWGLDVIFRKSELKAKGVFVI